MRAGPGDRLHLAYCTNVHPGEDWAETEAELLRHLPPLKAALAPREPFGVGLRLSNLAARELEQGGRLDRFAAWLDVQGLYVFTLNGFPYGSFHRTAVKSAVYAPDWTRHLAAPLVLIAFILVAAAYSPPNHFRSALGQPMLVGTKVWAIAHLFSNGTLADLLLFGGFLAWAVVTYRNARVRDRLAHVSYTGATSGGTIVSIVAGLVAWALFAFYLHGLLIGVRPLG